MHCTRPSSITTRIKTLNSINSIPLIETDSTVRDHLPLQQGLRLTIPVCLPEDLQPVRDHLPLQQGLRQMGASPLGTRLSGYETIVHYNKDLCTVMKFVQTKYETIFHYNKD